MGRKIYGTFCEQALHALRSVDKRSIRWKRSGRAWLLVACPSGEYSRSGRCRVGTRAVKILRPIKSTKRCPRGQKRIRKRRSR